jgi:hypothetical protein
MTKQSIAVSHLLGLIGAIVGGYLGYLGFGWFYRHGYYAMIMPGALLGLGCGLLARHPSTIRGVVCALGALALGFYTEWEYFPFRVDESLPYFLSHVHQIQSVGLVMIGVGALIAFWVGKDAGYSGLFPGGRKEPTTTRKP